MLLRSLWSEQMLVSGWLGQKRRGSGCIRKNLRNTQPLLLGKKGSSEKENGDSHLQNRRVHQYMRPLVQIRKHTNQICMAHRYTCYTGYYNHMSSSPITIATH